MIKFGSKVSADYRDYDAGSAGVTGNVGSNRWTGFGGDYAYNYDDGFGEITVGEYKFIEFRSSPIQSKRHSLN